VIAPDVSELARDGKIEAVKFTDDAELDTVIPLGVPGSVIVYPCAEKTERAEANSGSTVELQ
jgi:hypothetical protein